MSNAFSRGTFRFILATAALVSTLLIVTVGVGMLVGFLFPPRGDGAQFLFFWLDWRALPGLAIGLWMGIRAYRAIAVVPAQGDGSDPAKLP